MAEQASLNVRMFALLRGMEDKIDRCDRTLDDFLSRRPPASVDTPTRLLEDCRAMLLSAQKTADGEVPQPTVAIPAAQRDELLARITALLEPIRHLRS